MKQQADDRALASLTQAAQAGDAHAYARLLHEITPRLRHPVRGQRKFLKTEGIEDLVHILLSLHAVSLKRLRYRTKSIATLGTGSRQFEPA
jgi:hypothetical protein